jgi:hypothetical protein
MNMKKLAFLILVLSSVFCYSQNQRVRELQTQSTNNGNYYIIVDAGGWTRARKMTMNVATSLERNLRDYQDSLTRAGAGLNTTGAYIVLTGSNYLTAGDFAAIGLTGNINNATFILDSILYDLLNGIGCYSLCLDTIRCSGNSIFVECGINTDSSVNANGYHSNGSSQSNAIEIVDPINGGISVIGNETSSDDLAFLSDVSPYSALVIYEDSIGHAIDIIGDNIFNPDTAISVDHIASTKNNTEILIISGSGDDVSVRCELGNGANTAISVLGGSGVDYGVSMTGGDGGDYGVSMAAGDGNNFGLYMAGGTGTDYGVLMAAGDGNNFGLYMIGGSGADYGVNLTGLDGNDIGISFTGGNGADIGLDISAETAANLTGDVNVITGAFTLEELNSTAATDTCPDVTFSNVVFFNYAGGNLDLEGFKNGSIGQNIYIANKSANNIVIKNSVTVVAPAYNIITGSGSDVTITAEGGATFVFDGTNYYLIGVQQ